MRSTENKVNIIVSILVAIAASINVVILTTTQFELIEYPILLGVMLSVLIVVGILLILPRKKKLTPPSGRKPTEEERRYLERPFPDLKYCNYHVTAPKDCKYNCIEWSLCNDDEWVWDQVDENFGDNDGVVEISDFDAYYKSKGFTVCGKSSGECQPECKIRKVALFADGGKPTHAAKEVADGGWWESKIGKNIRIIHRLGQLEGEHSVYGNVSRCYCKADETANLSLCPKEA